MSRSVIYNCNTCKEIIEIGQGMAFKFGSDGLIRPDENWNESNVHVCKDCMDVFRINLAREQALIAALKNCVHVIEEGIAARIGDQWPAIKDLLPDAVSRAKAALSI
tara:strand:- start:8523 stop:8843 length:321 start_codon:yes stop_codon:yes gene_type:complete